MFVVTSLILRSQNSRRPASVQLTTRSRINILDAAAVSAALRTNPKFRLVLGVLHFVESCVVKRYETKNLARNSHRKTTTLDKKIEVLTSVSCNYTHLALYFPSLPPISVFAQCRK